MEDRLTDPEDGNVSVLYAGGIGPAESVITGCRENAAYRRNRMDKKVLLIGDTKSFMVNGIAGGLRRDNYDVYCVAPDVDDISHIKESFPIWVLYLDGMSSRIQRTLTYIKD